PVLHFLVHLIKDARAPSRYTLYSALRRPFSHQSCVMAVCSLTFNLTSEIIRGNYLTVSANPSIRAACPPTGGTYAQVHSGGRRPGGRFHCKFGLGADGRRKLVELPGGTLENRRGRDQGRAGSRRRHLHLGGRAGLRRQTTDGCRGAH